MKNYEKAADFHIDWEQISCCSSWTLSESGFNCSIVTEDKIPEYSTCIKLLPEFTVIFKVLQRYENEELWQVYTPAQETVKEFATIRIPLGHTIPDGLEIGSGHIGQNKDGTYVAFVPVQESIDELQVLKKLSKLNKKLDLHLEHKIGLNMDGFFDVETGQSLYGKVLGRCSIDGEYKYKDAA
jgi:hypothetical protein